MKTIRRKPLSQRTFGGIRSRNHLIRFDLSTGAHEAVKVDHELPWLPEYKERPYCNTWDKIIKDTFRLCYEPNKVIDHFYECIGYVMNPSNISKHQFVFFGPQDSGKHEILRVLKPLIRARPELITCEKFPAYNIKNDNHIYYTNVIPFYNNIDFQYQYTYYFDKIIANEMSGILRKCIKGIRRLILRGGFQHDLKDLKFARDKYFTTVDHVTKFITENYILHNEEKITVRQHDVWNKYKLWCTSKKDRLTKTQLISEFNARGIESNAYNNFMAISEKVTK